MHSFGVWLKQERERRGITLEELSMCTKVRIYYLRAIEQEQPELLPPGAIGRGFVRSYAKCVGLDEAEAVEGYSSLCATGRVAEKAHTKMVPTLKGYSDELSRLPVWVLAAACITVVLTLAYSRQYLEERYLGHQQPGEQIQTALTSSPRRAGVVVNRADASKPRAANFHVTRKFEASPSRELSTRQEESSVNSGVTSANVELDTFSVLIKVRRDAWMSVISDGHRVLSETLVAPAETLVKAHNRLVVRAGNIGAVEFRFNGISLPQQGEYDQARTLSFDAHGLQRQASSFIFPNTPADSATLPQ